MRRKQILFYSTADDLHAGLARLESAFSIKYVLAGSFDSPVPIQYASYRDKEGMGYSRDGRFEGLRSFLIMPKDEDVTFSACPQRKGGVKYQVSSHTCPSSITFIPGGEYRDACIIYGTVTGVDSANEMSGRLYKLFSSNVLKGYKKIKAFRVSPGAVIALENGVRLTPDRNADRSMDLAR